MLDHEGAWEQERGFKTPMASHHTICTPGRRKKRDCRPERDSQQLINPVGILVFYQGPLPTPVGLVSV